MQNKILRQVLLKQLCDYFRFDYDELMPIQAQQMLYIHDWVARNHQKVFLKDILYEISLLQTTLTERGRRRRLAELYWQSKMNSITQSGRYDTTTLKPPVQAFKIDYY